MLATIGAIAVGHVFALFSGEILVHRNPPSAAWCCVTVISDFFADQADG